MSTIAQFWLRSICAATFACTSAVALAEWGKGYVQDPFTLQYPEDPVERDWIEGVVFHAETGNYLVTYKDQYGFFSQIAYEPATKIEPVLKSRFKQIAGSAIRYEYMLRNGAKARQPVSALSTFISNLNSGSPIDPPGWWGTAIPGVNPPYLKLTWGYVGKDKAELMSEQPKGLAPGRNENGFSLESNDLPGVANVEIRGATRPTDWVGGAPEFHSPIGQELAKLQANDHVARLAAVPRISIGIPFDGAAVLDSLRTHITKELVALALIEPVFASQLDRILQAAADAIRRNSTKAAREHLHEALVAVHKEHSDLDREDGDKDGEDNGRSKPQTRSRSIDRLVASVVAFDLRYVEKRLR
jgi:hypothetical protein